MAKTNVGRKHDSAFLARVGKVVRAHRLKLGITQEELAWRAGLHRTYLADIERGGRNITLKSVANLAAAMQITVERLLGGSSDQNAGGSAVDAKGNRLGTVLLIEDCESDAELTVRALQKARLSNPIKVACDGTDALDSIFRTGRYARRQAVPMPELILLDLNLPGMPGIDVLRKLKAEERTRSIPVIVLSASRHDEAIIECGRLGAENYIVKPVSFEVFCELVPKLSLRWVLEKSGRRPSEVEGLPAKARVGSRRAASAAVSADRK